MNLYNADCMQIMPLLSPKSVRMVLCDLPYGITKCDWDRTLPLAELWEQYHRICTGPIVLFAALPFDKILAMSNLKNLRYEWIYEKPNATGFLHAKHAPLKAHENILVFAKGKIPYFPIKSTGHERKTVTRRSRSKLYNGHEKITYYDSTERYPRSVLKFSSDKQKSKFHPTQKPVALMEYLIRTYTKENEIVMDNCMGSGTTGVACKNTGRGFIGIEADKEYYDIAYKRILEI